VHSPRRFRDLELVFGHHGAIIPKVVQVPLVYGKVMDGRSRDPFAIARKSLRQKLRPEATAAEDDAHPSRSPQVARRRALIQARGDQGYGLFAISYPDAADSVHL
jgi:hypothetical protein